MPLKSRVRLCFALLVFALLVAAAPASAAFSPVVISQFRPDSTGGGDFVEITNISSSTLNLGTGWSISWLDPTGSNFSCPILTDYSNPSPGPFFIIRPPLSLAPGQRYLVTQPNNWSGTGDAASDESFHGNAGFQCGNLPDAGILTLTLGPDPNDVFGRPLGVDSVAYGAIPGDDGVPPGNQGTATLTEGHSFKPVPTDGRSIQRLNGGTQDNDNNKFDFQAVTAVPKDSIATATAPAVTTTDPSSITARSATLNGTANPHRAAVTDCHFQIDTTAAYSNPTTLACSPVTPVGQTDLPITAAATGLTPSATGSPSVYHYRLIVTTAKGTTTGNDKTVTTTLPDPPPSGTTNAATVVNAMSATLNGTINVHSGTVSDCHFEYGKSSLGLQVPCTTTPTGTNSVSVTAPVIDLDPSSDYAYRLVVTTENGTFTGPTNVPFHTNALAAADTDKIVISQLRTRGTGGDFVELANITSSTLTMQAGWSLGASTASGGGCSPLGLAGGPQVTLAPGQHYLIGGVTGADLGFASGTGRCGGNLPDTDAQITLVATDLNGGALLSFDAAAYGNFLGANEGPSELIVPNDGRALRRRVNGTQDTHRNADDFTVVTASPTGLAGTAPAPVVTTGTATALLQTTGTLNGTVNPKGGAVTNCHFDYGTTTSYGSSVPCATTPTGTIQSPVTAPATGLSPSTDYHAQLVVTTGAGTVTGGDMPFRTADPLPVPTGTTDTQGNLASATATLKASVNPHGAGVSDCHFDFGTTTAYGTSVPCATTPSGSNSVPVSAPVTDLLPSQAYHYRIRVTGDNGSLTGLDKSFTTNAVGSDSDKVVISQFRTRGVANGDYVELLNVSNDTVELTAGGWAMSDLASDGNSACVLVSSNNAPAVTLAPGQHYLVTQSGWAGAGTSASDLTFYDGSVACGNIIDGAGILGFSGGNTSDSVAYGALTGATATEPDPIGTVPSDGHALERRDSGVRDTGNNYDDFHVVTASPKNFFADPPPASVTTDAATGVGSARATFQGRVRPAGETITGCQFKYGTDADFATVTPYPHTVACNPSTPSGTGTVPVSATKTDLAPSTVYHFQLVAHGNVTGDIAGADQQVTTTAPPTATTDRLATAIGSRSLTVHATVNPHGETVTNCHFDYGTDASYGSSAPCSPTAPSGSSDVPVTGALTGLSPSTDYHVRIHITTSVAGELIGGEQVFTTTTAPSAATSDATPVGNTGATLHGTVDPKGETVTNCHFDYGTDTSYGLTAPCSSTPTGIGANPVSAQLSNLTSTTGYHFRLVVTTNGSPLTPIVGDDFQFTTTTPPSVTTDDFGAVGSRSATLNGTLRPHGDTLTTCRFEYSTDMSFGSSVPCTPATQFSGTSDIPVSAVLTGLQPSTDYHVRLFVSSASSGTVLGATKTLSTTTTPSAAIGSADPRSHRSATLNGTVEPHGETVTDCHFEYGTDTSYGSSKPCASTPSGTTASPVSADLTGLTPGTTYHQRVVITTDGNATPVASTDGQFTTLDPATATADEATPVAARSATLKGTVTPNGETISGCHFDYGTDTSYGSTAPCAGTTAVSAALTGLTPSTSYHYRLVITTVGGGTTPILGADRQLTTGNAATVATDAASSVSHRATTLNGTVTPNGETVTGCHFEYGTDTSYGSTTACASTPSGTSASPVSADLSGLTPGTTYHARVVITTAGGGTPLAGADRQFTTSAPAAATTDPATPVAARSATLKGTVASNGETISGCHFDYGNDTSYGSTTPCASTPSGASASPVSADLSGLAPGTTYHARVVITTDGGGTPVAGADRQFTTLAGAAVVTEPASGIASDAATLDGTVTPNGETISDCHFDYGTDTSYGSSAPCGSTSGAVSATLTGLAASTGYHYRLVITPAGASPITGADQQFTTAAAPNPAPGTGSGDPGTGTPGPGPGPQPGPPEVTPAQLAKAASVSGTKRATRGGSVKLGRLTCPAICGAVKVLAKHGTTVVGRGSGKLTTGHSLAADFQLNAAARRLLKRVGRLSVKVTVTVTDATGAVVTVTRSMVLKPAP